MGDYTFILKGAGVTDTVRASSSAKDKAPPSTSGAEVGAGAGAGAGAPKKSARGKSFAFFSGFCLVQVITPVTMEVDKFATTYFAAATAVATVLDDFFSTTISTFLSMFSSVNLRLSFLSPVVSRRRLFFCRPTKPRAPYCTPSANRRWTWGRR